MEKGSSGDGGLKLQVCQLAEMKTFEDGFRGAWFRCKINDVDFKKNKILLEYYDFEEEITWTNIYDLPPHLELPMPPAGQGKDEDVLIAFCKELRPSLDWSQRKGWTLPTVINDVDFKKNKILLEYYDFEEEITWTNIYDLPPHVKKSSWKKKQLMLRPQYPLLYDLYYKNEQPPVNSISEICVVIDDAWKVGDMVDWYKDDCYWSARVIKVLSNDKVQ
nr:agenet-like domain-containing protein [Tanacetum cinerariifolium]